MSNFRCHENKKIDLPEEGLVLLDGMSGQGKSTILDAFSYTLFGKPNKPYTFGKRTCQVTIYLKSLDMKIVRSSGPSRLLVYFKGEEYEGLGAQGIINTEICNINEFDYGCYIKQKSADSLVTMTPTQQLEFVQTMSFEDRNTSIKEAIKTKIQLFEKKQTSEKSKLEVTESELEKLNKYKAIADPLEGKTEEETRQNIENLKLSKKTSISKLEKNKKKIEDISEILKIQEELNKELETLRNTKKPDDEGKQNKIKKMYKRLIDLEREKENLKKKDEYRLQVKSLQSEIDEAKEKLDTLKTVTNEEIKQMKNYIKNHEKYLDLQEELEEEEDGFNKIKKPNEEFSFTEYEELLQEKEDYKLKLIEYNKSKKDYENLLVEIEEELNEEIESLSPKQIYKKLNNYIQRCGNVFECPSCEAHIVKRGDTYHITDEELGGEEFDQKSYEKILEFKSKIKNFNSVFKKEKPEFNEGELKRLFTLKSSWDDYERKTENLQELIRDLKKKIKVLEMYSNEEKAEEYEEKLEVINKENAERSTYQKIISTKTEKMTQIKLEKLSMLEDDVNEEDLLQEVFEIKAQLTYTTLKQYLENQDKILNLYIRQSQKVEDLQEELQEENIEDLQVENLKLKKDKQRLESEITLCGENIEDLQNKILDYVQKYLPYQKKKELETKYKKEKQDLESIESALRNYYILKDKCRQAEILSIEETVESINVQSKYYLDRMFPDLPIEVRLENYKPTGKGKNMRTEGKMNMSIFYKNNEYDSISQLSGGERDRVNLAFILAVNDMIGGEILFLDECLSSLDTETNTDIYMFLKNNCQHRLIIAVSHEAVRGLFDFVVDVVDVN